MISVKLPNQSAIITVMTKAAVKASKGLLRDFNELENLQVSVKTNKTFVTSADLRTDKLLRKSLSFARPSYSILTEESGELLGEDPSYKWVVDPLDGTFNFMHGFPHWAISIALRKNDETIAAVTYDPIKNEMFWAEKGCGAYLNDRKIRVSSKSKLDDLLVSLGNLSGIQKSLTQSVRKSGSMTLDMAYLAAGRVDVLYCAPDSNEWDIAAGMLFIKEAGGVLLDRNGKPAKSGKDLAVMTNIRLSTMALKLVQI